MKEGKYWIDSYAFFLSVVEKRGQNKLLLLKIMSF